MKKSILQIVIFLTTVLVSETTYSQQEMQPEKYDNAAWQKVILFQFKPGKFSRAEEIIDNYYLVACKKSGSQLPSLLIEMVSGEWDLMLVWDMKDGIDELNWKLSPNDVKWMKGMNDITGDNTKTQAIMDEFSSLIDHEVTYIGKSGMPVTKQ